MRRRAHYSMPRCIPVIEQPPIIVAGQPVCFLLGWNTERGYIAGWALAYAHPSAPPPNPTAANEVGA